MHGQSKGAVALAQQHGHAWTDQFAKNSWADDLAHVFDHQVELAVAVQVAQHSRHGADAGVNEAGRLVAAVGVAQLHRDLAVALVLALE